MSKTKYSREIYRLQSDLLFFVCASKNTRFEDTCVLLYLLDVVVDLP